MTQKYSSTTLFYCCVIAALYINGHWTGDSTHFTGFKCSVWHHR